MTTKSSSISYKDQVLNYISGALKGPAANHTLIYDFFDVAGRVKLLVRTETTLLFQLPAGKPDPKLPSRMDLLSCDTRARVRQSPQKGSTCTTYALKMILPRIGKKPSKNLKELRKAEKALSEFRKNISRFDELHVFRGLSDPKSAEATKQITLREATGLVYLVDHKSYKPHSPEAVPYYRDYISKHRNFANFFDYLCFKCCQALRPINEAYLKELKMPPSLMYHNAITIDQRNVYNNLYDLCRQTQQKMPAEYSPKYESLPFFIQSYLIDRYTMHATASKFGLVKSAWTPKAGLASLMKELDLRGPLVFSCAASFIADGKSRALSIRQVFTSSLQLIAYGHAVTLVGTNVSQNVIYYVDPADGSDPDDEGVQKIYSLDYTSFTQSLMPIDHSNRNCLYTPEVRFAWGSPYFQPF